MKARAPHTPPKKILVPLDLSDASVAAWDYARTLGRTLGAKVDGLYVQEWLHSALGLGQGAPLLTARASRQALIELRARLGEDVPVVSETGPVEDTILSWGRELGYDLIVMGTHGRTGVEHALMGSVAETVVRYSEVPVLVVHGPPRTSGAVSSRSAGRRTHAGQRHHEKRRRHGRPAHDLA